MKTAEEILTDFGCSDIPFDENVTMYYPSIVKAMEEYAAQFQPPQVTDGEIYRVLAKYSDHDAGYLELGDEAPIVRPSEVIETVRELLTPNGEKGHIK